jgi:aspartyl-tRNA(Asn)/glutamyl-tRNA(Gln) amidotransferase subunit A
VAGLWRLDAAALAAGFGRGDFTPVDAARACLDRIARTHARLNAFVQVDPQATLAMAQASAARWAAGRPLSALDGVPVSLKDNLHAQDWATTWGSRALQGFRPTADEEPVARLRRAGLVFLGKTNLPEFAMQGHTANELHGTTRNPWDPDRTPGGSSGGAAAAVAAGCGPLALATDGGGSTRRPASHCGLVGYKPSGGWLPRQGGLPEIFLDFEVPGVFARRVDDAAALLQVLAGAALPAAPRRPLRILFLPRFAAHPVDPAIDAAVRQAAQRWADLGHQVTEAAPFMAAEPLQALWPALSGMGLAWMLSQAGLPGALRDTSAWTPASRAALDPARGASSTELFEVLAQAHALRREVDALFMSHDLLLTPATAVLPWPVDQAWPDRIAGQPVGPRGHAVFTAFANAAGLPAIALPSALAEGLPTGFQLVAAARADALLLAAAREWEAAHPWTEEIPLP